MDGPTSDTETLTGLEAIEGKVRRDQAAATVAALAMALPSNMLVALVTVLMLWHHLPAAFLVGWTSVIAIVNAGRYCMVRRARVSGAFVTQPDHVLRASSIGAVVAGLVWGTLPIVGQFIVLESTSHLLFLLSGLAAGAVVLGPAHARTSINFAVPILLATIIGRLTIGGPESLLFGFAAIFYTLMLVRSARQAERNFCEGSRTRHSATALAEALRLANGETLAKATMLQVIASHDALTGLANRSAFTRGLETRIGEGAGRQVSLLMLDLDHFKHINDTLGHGAGDRVLEEVAVRLRDACGEELFAARFGGDEFALLLDGEEAPEDAARTILEAVARPIVIGDRHAMIGASIGIACFPKDAATAENLMLRADLALYAAKEGGRQRFCRFDRTLRDAAQVRRDIERDLPRALVRGEIEVWHQPQVSLADHTVVGLELLIRWKHQDHGWISPPDIVSAARSTYQSDVLTLYVVAQACRLIRQLRETGFGHVTVAVNVSPQELGTYPLAARIAAVLASEGVPARSLEIEITEEAAIAGTAATHEVNALAALGVRIAIDDFGIGYSSLASLRTLPIQRIKIDRSFVTDMASREGDRVLVQAILGIGRSLGLEVVAEGVESANDALLLAHFGCHVAQGYHFARPMTRSDFNAWIVDHRVRLAG